MFLSKRMEHTRPPSRTVYWDSLFNKNFSKYFLKTYATVDGATDSLLSHSASSCSLLTEQDGRPAPLYKGDTVRCSLVRTAHVSLASLSLRAALSRCVRLAAAAARVSSLLLCSLTALASSLLSAFSRPLVSRFASLPVSSRASFLSPLLGRCGRPVSLLLALTSSLCIVSLLFLAF